MVIAGQAKALRMRTVLPSGEITGDNYMGFMLRGSFKHGKLWYKVVMMGKRERRRNSAKW